MKRASIVAWAALLAAPALAQSPPPAQFEGMDTDRDGRVSRNEHGDAVKKMFAIMDADRDGKVTAAEMDVAHEKVTGKKSTPRGPRATEKIKAIDGNGDGVLSAEEHTRGAHTMFYRMDTNRDGFLDKAEWNTGHAGLR